MVLRVWRTPPEQLGRCHSRRRTLRGNACGRASCRADHSPRSMHVQIVRSVPSGLAWARAAVRHPGRTVPTVEVDLHDHREKLAAIALFTMVTPDAVAAEFDRTVASPPFDIAEVALPPVPESRIAPIRPANRRQRRRARNTTSAMCGLSGGGSMRGSTARRSIVNSSPSNPARSSTPT